MLSIWREHTFMAEAVYLQAGDGQCQCGVIANEVGADTHYVGLEYDLKAPRDLMAFILDAVTQTQRLWSMLPGLAVQGCVIPGLGLGK